METELGGVASEARIALWAAVVGLGFGLLISAVNGTLSFDERTSNATTLGGIAFVAVFTVPFLAVIASYGLHDLDQRRAVWLGAAGAVAILGVLAIFSIGVVFLCVAAVLVIAWLEARGRRAEGWRWEAAALMLWIIQFFGGAVWLLLLWRRDTPRCWSGSESTATGPREWRSCSSDIIDTTEGALALGAVALGITGAVVILRLWRGGGRPLTSASGRASAMPR
jgi:hypothetical protein